MRWMIFGDTMFILLVIKITARMTQDLASVCPILHLERCMHQHTKKLIHVTTWMDLKGIMKTKKLPIWKSQILYNSIYATFLK